MNTSIQDAYNLAWEVALVAKANAPAALLDSYDLERHRVGEILLRGTDRMFVAAAGGGWVSTFVRTLVPIVATRLFGLPFFNRRLARFISQLSIRSAKGHVAIGADEVERGLLRPVLPVR